MRMIRMGQGRVHERNSMSKVENILAQKQGARHNLPALDAGKVVGMISLGEVVKEIIRDLKLNVNDLMGYVMADGPGG